MIYVSTVSASAYSYVKRTDGASYSYEVGGHSHSHSSPSYSQHQHQTHHQSHQTHHQIHQSHQNQQRNLGQQPQYQRQVQLPPQGDAGQQQLQPPVQQTQQAQASNQQTTQQTLTGQPTQQYPQQNQGFGSFDNNSQNVQNQNRGQVQNFNQGQGNFNQGSQIFNQGAPNVNQGSTSYNNQGQSQIGTQNFRQNPVGQSGFQHSTGHGDSFGYPQYKFEYGVKDPRTGDHKSQWEQRDGDVVRGEYTLDEADGTKRIVEYKADSKNGFNAIVKKIGHAHHPEIQVFGRPF